MAELLLKVGAGSGFEDGDVICAFSRRRIRSSHAERICHRRRGEGGSGVLRPRGTLFEKWYELTHEFRNERVSPTEVLRTRLADGTIEVLGPKPNAKDEAIDVRLYLARRLAWPTHRIFGTPGSEVWYSGRFSRARSVLDAVWAEITNETGITEGVDWRLWHFGRLEIRHFLALRAEELTNKEAEDLVEPLYETQGGLWVWERSHPNGVPGDVQTSVSAEEPAAAHDEEPWRKKVRRKARHRIAWETDCLDDLQETAANVRDPRVKVGFGKDLPPFGRARFSKVMPLQPKARARKKDQA